MNKIIISFFILFSIVSATAQVGDKQLNLTTENISKKWIFKDLINSKFNNAEYNQTKELMEDVSLEIRKDKTCLMSFILDLEGTWELDVIKKTITITDRKGTNIWKIHSLKENQIILSRNDAIQKIIFQTN